MISVRTPLVLDFSGTYPLLACPGDLPGAAREDFRSLEGTSCYLDPEAERVIAERIGRHPPGGVHFIDGGDYHYMTNLFLRRVGEPFHLLVLDNHPDMQEPLFAPPSTPGGILSCGGWLRDSLRGNPNLRRVLLVGVDDALLSECDGFGERVRVVPRSVDPLPLVDGLSSFLSSGGDLPLYVSVDKDVLAEEECPTNWDGGCMEVGTMLSLLGSLLAGRRVLGVDICGEKSPSKGGTPRDHALSSRVNRSLLDLICSLAP